MKTVCHEIVRVAQPAFLVNSLREACRYETADNRTLARGYYFALWPAKVAKKAYDPTVCYFGPFATYDEAQLVQASATYFGIVAAETGATPSNGEAQDSVRSLSSQYDQAASFCSG